MSEQVRVKYDADMAAFFREAKKATEEQRKFVSELRKTKGASKEAEDSSAKWLGGMASQLTTVLGSVVSIGTAIRTLTAEFDELERKRKAAHDASMTVEQARAGALSALSGGMTPQDVDAGVNRLASLGMQPQQAYMAYQAGMSSRLGLSQPAFEDAMYGAARIHTRTGWDMQMTAPALMTTSRITGMPDFRANMGALLQWGGATAIRDPQNLMRNLLPMLQGGVQAGYSAEQAMEEMAAITHYAVDPEGSESATQFRNIARAMSSNIVPEVGRGGAVSWGFIPDGIKGDLNKEFEFLGGIFKDAPQKAQEEMLTKFGRTGLSRFYAKGRLTGDPVIGGLLGDARAAIDAPGPQSAEHFNRFMDITASARMDLVEAEFRSKAERGLYEYGDIDRAREQGASNVLDDFLTPRTGWTDKMWRKGVFHADTYLTGDATGAARRAIRSRALIQQPLPAGDAIDYGMPYDPFQYRPYTEDEIRALDTLNTIDATRQEAHHVNRKDTDKAIEANTELAIDQRRRENIGDSY